MVTNLIYYNNNYEQAEYELNELAKENYITYQVAQVYYKDKDIKRIAVYCEKDVLAIAQVLLKFKLEPLLNKEEIVSVNL